MKKADILGVVFGSYSQRYKWYVESSTQTHNDVDLTFYDAIKFDNEEAADKLLILLTRLRCNSMKIQTVRFKNLNSLSGEWLIDFTDPHFTSSGIFAIVGATGAGKTTILDAISLALYGRTPRLKQISKSTNEIMSRQTGDCFSEVEFLSSKGTFRVHWSQHRARKSANGDLQPPRHEFVDAKNNKILASKLRDVGERVSDTTGMNFDQFTRSMLLAQGDFSKFLQASSDQRAPILEQITGTEIYSLISKQVHQCKTEEEKKLDTLHKELENLQILSLEEIQTVRDKQATTTATTTQLQAQIKTINSAINWHQTIANLLSKKKELEVVATELQQKWDSATQFRDQLEKATKSHLLEGTYNHITHLRTIQKDEQSLLSATAKQITELKEVATQLKQKKQAAEEFHRDTIKDQKATAEIIKVVHQLDYEIQKKTEEIVKLNIDLTGLEKEISTLTEDAKKSDTQIASCREKISAITHYQLSNQADEQLVETFSGIEEKSTRRTQLLETAEKLQATMKQLQLQLQKHTIQEQQRKNTILHSIEKEKQLGTELKNSQKNLAQHAPKGLPALYQETQALRDEFRNLGEIKRLMDEKHQLTDKHNSEIKNQETIKTQICELQKEIKQTKNLLLLQTNNVNKQEEIVLLANKIEDFEQERAKLIDNSPCPLCGSTDHPFNVSRELIADEVKAKLHAEKDKLSALDKKGRNLEISFNRLTHSGEICAAYITEVAEKLHILSTRIQALCPDNNIPTNIDTVLAQVGEKVVASEQATRQAEQHNLSVTKYEQELKNLTTNLQSDKELLQHSQQKKGKLETELELNIRNYKTIQEEIADLTSLLFELLSPYIKKTLSKPEEIDPALLELRQKLILWKQSSTSLRDQEKLLQSLTATIDRVVQSIEIHKKEKAKIQEQSILLSKDRETTKTKRQELFGEKDPHFVDKALQNQVAVAEQSLKKVQDEFIHCEKQASILHERNEQLHLSVTKREEILKTEESKFFLLLQQHDFESETMFLQSRLPDEKREELKIQLDTLEAKCKEAKSKLLNVEETIAEESAKKTTTESHDTLLIQLEVQSAELAQLQQQLGAITEQINNYENNIKHQKNKQDRLEQQKIEYGYWAQLHTLVGSADGKKFRNFAQGLTFELMVHHANQTLEKMSDRYLLRRSPDEPLELTVIDAYQAGEIRSTANLSGGETFIISLALALGLSAMASQKVQIDSLFLDEGFGTLDEESLEIALETLSTLQQHGKIIGIISHVPLLKERIDVQLHLLAGLDGKSKISGPGVSAFHEH